MVAYVLQCEEREKALPLFLVTQAWNILWLKVNVSSVLVLVIGKPRVAQFNVRAVEDPVICFRSKVLLLHFYIRFSKYCRLTINVVGFCLITFNLVNCFCISIE